MRVVKCGCNMAAHSDDGDGQQQQYRELSDSNRDRECSGASVVNSKQDAAEQASAGKVIQRNLKVVYFYREKAASGSAAVERKKER